MKKNSLSVSLSVMIILLGLLSCKKDKNVDDAMTDVYVKAILSDGLPVFGLVHYVLGYSKMTSVTVQFPGGTSDQLNAYDASKTVYYAEPSLTLGTYSDTPPESGEYSYGVTFEDGAEKVFTNELGDDYLLPATIVSIGKAPDNQSVNMSWEPLTGAEYFQLSIYKEGTQLYLSNPFSPPSGNNLIMPLALIPSYYPGVYTFQLDAVIYESAESSKIQAISSASVSTEI